MFKLGIRALNLTRRKMQLEQETVVVQYSFLHSINNNVADDQLLIPTIFK